MVNRAGARQSRCISTIAAAFGMILVIGGATSCPAGIGDRVQTLYVHNATDITVLVYNVDWKSKTPDAKLAPGETWETWVPVFANPVSRTYKAYDESGNLMFCRRYTMKDLETGGWEVEIRKGEIACD